MREYETVFIIDPSCDESQVEQEVNTVKEIIAAGSGNVVEAQSWGRRRLAYDIKKKSEGIYAILDINATPASVSELDRQLGLNESVLRTKVMRPEIR